MATLMLAATVFAYSLLVIAVTYMGFTVPGVTEILSYVVLSILILLALTWLLPIVVDRKHVPNILTVMRVVFVPIIVALFFSETFAARLMRGILFILAAVSDGLDGFLARRWGAHSDFGRMMDPIADKVCCTTALFMIAGFHAHLHRIHLVPIVFILMRELLISSLRESLGPRGIVIHASKLGKWKTALQLVGLCFSVLSPCVIEFDWIGVPLLWISSGLGVVSGLRYFISALGHFSTETSPDDDDEQLEGGSDK